MEPVVVVNRFVIKAGKMDEFIAAQRSFVRALPPCGLVGGRMYRGKDGRSAVLVSVFESREAQEAIGQRADFKEHLGRLQPIVESSSPAVYDEAYTAGDFR